MEHRRLDQNLHFFPHQVTLSVVPSLGYMALRATCGQVTGKKRATLNS